jgi:hypothetical protein
MSRREREEKDEFVRRMRELEDSNNKKEKERKMNREDSTCTKTEPHAFRHLTQLSRQVMEQTPGCVCTCHI